MDVPWPTVEPFGLTAPVPGLTVPVLELAVPVLTVPSGVESGPYEKSGPDLVRHVT